MKMIRFTFVVIACLLCTLLMGQDDREVELFSSFDWEHIFMTQLHDDSILILGADKTSWEFIVVNNSKSKHRGRVLSMNGAIPSAVTSSGGQVYIGGNLTGKSAIWHYSFDVAKPKLLHGFHDHGKVIDLIAYQSKLLVLIDHTSHFSLSLLDSQTDSLYLIEKLEKRAKNEKALVKRNHFGEIFLVRSSPFASDRSPLEIRKYNDHHQALWHQSYPPIKGTLTCLLIHSSGDLLGAGISTHALRSDLFMVRWAPNGRMIAHMEEDHLDKSVSVQIGWINEHTFWSISDKIPFGARLPDIDIRQYSLATLQVIEESQISGKAVEDMQAYSVDGLANVSVLYKKSQKGPFRLKYILFNQDPCSGPLSHEGIKVTYNTTAAPMSGNDQYEFEATIKTKNQLLPTDVRLHLVASNSKVPEATNLVLLSSEKEQLCYRASKRFYLQEGENAIRISINKDELSYNDTISIFNMVERPNLYIFSVGVVYEDLNFTQKDAADFASLFIDQEGRLFEKVHRQLLNTKENTKAVSIISHLDDFTRLPINDQDLVFIFFSSHGDIINDEFSILGSNYDFKDQSTMVNFKHEIIRRVSTMKGKKVLFLDACKSGNLKGKGEEVSPQLVSSIFRVIESNPGILAISSSTDEQSSYEVNDLQNGIFTAAIKELFNQTYETHDINQDQVLTIGELYEYLGTRVPQLIEQYFRDPNRKQNPTMPLSDIDQELPIYYIAKKRL